MAELEQLAATPQEPVLPQAVAAQDDPVMSTLPPGLFASGRPRASDLGIRHMFYTVAACQAILAGRTRLCMALFRATP